MTPTESRVALELALTNGGVRVLPQGAVAPPSVFVAPGNPWMAPAQLARGRFSVLWQVFAIVGVQSEAAITDSEALAVSIQEACKSLTQEWSKPSFDAPGWITLGGTQYIAFRALIQSVL